MKKIYVLFLLSITILFSVGCSKNNKSIKENIDNDITNEIGGYAIVRIWERADKIEPFEAKVKVLTKKDEYIELVEYNGEVYTREYYNNEEIVFMKHNFHFQHKDSSYITNPITYEYAKVKIAYHDKKPYEVLAQVYKKNGEDILIVKYKNGYYSKRKLDGEIIYDLQRPYSNTPEKYDSEIVFIINDEKNMQSEFTNVVFERDFYDVPLKVSINGIIYVRLKKGHFFYIKEEDYH